VVVSKESEFDKRRFPRFKNPVYYHPVQTFGISRETSDISLGGVRIYSNNPLKEKQSLEIELLLPSGKSVVASVRVAWINVLPPGSEALYDVGLEFTNLPEDSILELKSALDVTSSE
jgi:hypothetical protein